VHAATLPTGVEHLGHGGLDALVRVGDDELDAAQAPAGASLRKNAVQNVSASDDVHAENLAPAVAVDADRDNDRDRHDAGSDFSANRTFASNG
jgi:hypothetical protein